MAAQVSFDMHNFVPPVLLVLQDELPVTHRIIAFALMGTWFLGCLQIGRWVCPSINVAIEHFNTKHVSCLDALLRITTVAKFADVFVWAMNELVHTIVNPFAYVYLVILLETIVRAGR